MNQCMKALHCMAHICAVDLIVIPYFHLKRYMAIHGNLNDKFSARFPLGDQLQLFDPYWCVLFNRGKDIGLVLQRA